MSLPLLLDIDTGCGGDFNISRTIKNMIDAGFAAVHMEDKVSQKRCGHRPNKSLVTKEEMQDRIKAAVDGRQDESFFIMARTDAIASEGIDGAVDRISAYVEDGADGMGNFSRFPDDDEPKKKIKLTKRKRTKEKV